MFISRSKKAASILVALFIFVKGAFAQVSANPNDDFYKNVMTWEVQGLVTNLPQVRPYPLHIVKNILEEVIESGEEKESILAQAEYERIFGRKWHAEIYAGDTYKAVKSTKAENNESKNFFEGDFHLLGDAQLLKAGGISYYLGAYGIHGGDEKEKNPLFTNIIHDAVQDPSYIKGFKCFADMNCNAFFGNDIFFGTMGISRFGFGPFWQEGLALNDTAYHSAGLNMTLRFAPGWQFNTLFTSLGATNNVGGGFSSAKFLAMHSLRWQISKRWALSYYENAVFGRRFEFSYLFPSPYLINQGINGCNDNVQMGVQFEVRPLDTVKVSGDFFVDDFAIRKLSLDDKYRCAFSLGVQYAPKNTWIRMIDLNYTAVMPYVYAHWEYDDNTNYSLNGNTINYQNYTNSGICMGSSLEPDSDRLKLHMRINPVKNLELDFNAGFTRHQNVCESLSDIEAVCYLLSENGKYATDGSLFTHQLFENNEVTSVALNSQPGDIMYLDSAWNRLMFMTGNHTMLVFKMGVNASYTLGNSKTGSFKIGFSYNLDYIKNAGVDKNIYPGQGGLKSLGDGKYEWNGKTYESAEVLVQDATKAVESARKDWADSLHDTVNHYFTLSFTYCW